MLFENCDQILTIGVNKLLYNEGKNPASRTVKNWETNSTNCVFKALVVA